MENQKGIIQTTQAETTLHNWS